MKDKIRPKGELTLELRDKHGNLKYKKTHRNLIVDDGKEIFVDRVAGLSSQQEIVAVALGSDDGTTLPLDASNTALGAEPGTLTGTVRKATTNSRVGSNIARFQATFGAGEAIGAITESGLFCDTTKGGANDKMACRVIFSPVNKGSSATLTATWEITFA